MKKRFIAYVLAILLAVFMAGCGTESGTTGGTTTAATVSGQVVDGPIAGSSCKAYTINADGTKGAAAGTATTDSTGRYTMSVSTTGALLNECSGGSYTDWATGNTVTLSTSDILSTVIPNATGTVTANVTPLTHMASQLSLKNIAGGTSAASAIPDANNKIGQYFGVNNILATTLIDPTAAGSATGATQESKDYTLILAGISQYAKTNSITNPFELVNALAKDASDGTFDGKQGTTQVTAGSLSLTATTATSGLGTAIAAFQADTSRNTSGMTVTSTILTTLATGTGVIGGTTTGGTISITVGSGLTPAYSWSGGNVYTVSVMRTSAPTVPVWGVATPNSDSIASPVTHGTTPSVATATSTTETTLTAGVQYRVSVTRLNGSTGYTDFTPASTSSITPLTSGSNYNIAYTMSGSGSDVRYPVIATFDTSGNLTEYATGNPSFEAPTIGTNSNNELGGDADFSWGRWAGGTTAGVFYNLTLTNTSTEGFHYIIGKTPSSSSLPATSITYTLYGFTKPTLKGASGLGTLDSAKMVVDFASKKVGIEVSVTLGGTTYTLSSTGGTADPSQSEFTIDTSTASAIPT